MYRICKAKREIFSDNLTRCRVGYGKGMPNQITVVRGLSDLGNGDELVRCLFQIEMQQDESIE